ncbi:hypothetical protein JXO59_16945 [candidate division KSB1 bacterium]|nr:hypothetical protein [candidate division KSB1 bacterium]
MRSKYFPLHIRIVTTLFILFLFSVPALAVSEAAVLFLLISPSAQANGMGQTYGNIFDTDPAASAMNPAALGFYARDHYFGISLNRSQWLPDYDLDYLNYNLIFGYDLNKTHGLPIAIGLGYQYIYLDLGEVWATTEESPEPIGTFKSSEKAHVLTAAASFDFIVRGSVGLSIKRIHSDLGPTGAGAENEAKTSADAIDFGVILQLPLWNLAEKLSNTELFPIADFKPIFTPGLFISRRNIGDEIKYIDAFQADPLPRTVNVGATLEMGIAYHSKSFSFDMLSIRCSREAEDMLIDRHPDGSFDYLSGLNDIAFASDILLGKANDRIITKKGWQFGLGDMIFLRTGRYDDNEGKVRFRSEGFGINFMSPLKTLVLRDIIALEDNLLKKLLLNLNIEYHYSRFESDLAFSPVDDTEFRSLLLSLRSFPL